MSLADLLDLFAPLKPYELDLLGRAYSLAESLHGPTLRKSGESYFVHIEAVARYLATWGLDAGVVAAGLLHDAIEDTPLTLGEVEAQFGPEVARLVDGVTKIDALSRKLSEPEYLKKTLSAAQDDVRVILIKLADRLHNMQTLQWLSHKRQEEISKETRALFAPLAGRLGMWRVRQDLLDLSFKFLRPDIYSDLARRLAELEQEQAAFWEAFIPHLCELFAPYGFLPQVQRPYHTVYSAYEEMRRKSIALEETLVLRGVRLLVEDTMACYGALGVVHQHFKPIAGRFDDYIASPKGNFYQSLHTGVLSPQLGLLEFQIRTFEMDKQAEQGVLAAWRFYNSDPPRFERDLQARLAYLHQLIAPAHDESTADDFVQSVIDAIDDQRILVRSPRGDVYELPRGATPIDFAYHVHTEVGHRCRGAKVNQKIVALNYNLQKNDVVEILTSNRGGPNLEWLDERLGYVKTPGARAKIRAWFRKQGAGALIAAGQRALDAKLRQLGVTDENAESLRLYHHYNSSEDLLEQIGLGLVSPAKLITQKLDAGRKTSSVEVSPQTPLLPILGATGYKLRLARCCRPESDDDIIGYITGAYQISVHCSTCPVLNSRPDLSGRLTPVRWARRSYEALFEVPVQVRASNRPGMMGDVGRAAEQANVNLSRVFIQTQGGQALFDLVMEVESYHSLSQAMAKLEAIEGVLEVKRATSDTPNHVLAEGLLS